MKGERTCGGQPAQGILASGERGSQLRLLLGVLLANLALAAAWSGTAGATPLSSSAAEVSEESEVLAGIAVEEAEEATEAAEEAAEAPAAELAAGALSATVLHEVDRLRARLHNMHLRVVRLKKHIRHEVEVKQLIRALAHSTTRWSMHLPHSRERLQRRYAYLRGLWAARHARRLQLVALLHPV